MKKMWVMRRLKKLGADNTDLLEVYLKQVRSVAEYAVPVWNSALTREDSGKLERIQKTACNIILGQHYDAPTTVQVTTVQADNCPGDNCPGRQLSR